MTPDVAEPLAGSSEEIAAGLHSVSADDIGHRQLYLVPTTIERVERFAAGLDLPDRR